MHYSVYIGREVEGRELTCGCDAQLGKGGRGHAGPLHLIAQWKPGGEVLWVVAGQQRLPWTGWLWRDLEGMWPSRGRDALECEVGGCETQVK
jgi:hypothetical protein